MEDIPIGAHPSLTPGRAAFSGGEELEIEAQVREQRSKDRRRVGWAGNLREGEN